MSDQEDIGDFNRFVEGGHDEINDEEQELDKIQQEGNSFSDDEENSDENDEDEEDDEDDEDEEDDEDSDGPVRRSVKRNKKGGKRSKKSHIFDDIALDAGSDEAEESSEEYYTEEVCKLFDTDF